jgi:CBS domain-containing protein
MTKDVLSVAPDTSLKQVAATLVEHDISGLPVCDADGQVVGVVSEADILYKESGEPRRRSGGALAWLVDSTSYESVLKSTARTAGETMGTPPITIGPMRPVADAARLMIEHGINRLPVVDEEERLVGIITRADLVRAFKRSDAEIERELREDLIERTLWIPSEGIEIDVENGEVVFEGLVETRSDAQLVERLAGRVPGVVSVRSSLTWRYDDIRRKPKPTPARS